MTQAKALKWDFAGLTLDGMPPKRDRKWTMVTYFGHVSLRGIYA
jgi:hypothetical protein